MHKRIIMSLTAMVLYTAVSSTTKISEAMADDSSSGYAFGTVVNGVSLGVVSGSPSLKAGDPLIFKIKLKNLGDTPITVNQAVFASDYDYQIRSDGKEIARKKPDGTGFEVYSGPRTVTLNHNDEDTEVLDLSTLYDLRPGSYSIVIMLPVRAISPASTFRCSSPALNFSIK